MVSVLKNDLVIKSNTLIEACFNLSLTEYRILQIAFTELAEYESDKGLFHTREFKVYAQDYSKIFNIDESNAYGLSKFAITVLSKFLHVFILNAETAFL